MMFPIDIHTHRSDKPERGVTGGAIINTSPNAFIPQTGCWYSIGVHPWDIPNSGHSSEMDLPDWNLFEEQISHPQVVALGEAGLDKYAKAPLDLQEQIFIRQARLASKHDKPLIIHAVKTANRLWDLKREITPATPWIIHGFRGNTTLAKQYLQHGFYLSFGEHYQEEALRATPLNHLFLETDESAIPIYKLYERAASLMEIPTDQLLETVGENIGKVFFKS